MDVMEQFNDASVVDSDFIGFGGSSVVEHMETSDSVGGFGDLNHSDLMAMLESTTGSGSDMDNSQPVLASTATNGELVTQLGNICGNLIAVAADSSYTLEAEEINEEPVIVPPVIDQDNSFTIDTSDYETDHLDHLDDAVNYAVTPANDSGSFVILKCRIKYWIYFPRKFVQLKL